MGGNVLPLQPFLTLQIWSRGGGGGNSLKVLPLQPFLTLQIWSEGGGVIPQKSSHCSPSFKSFYPPPPAQITPFSLLHQFTNYPPPHFYNQMREFLGRTFDPGCKRHRRINWQTNVFYSIWKFLWLSDSFFKSENLKLGKSESRLIHCFYPKRRLTL